MTVDQRAPTLSCTHYRRHCTLQAKCCNKLYPCRLCHDASPGSCTVEMDRHAVARVCCEKCGLLQLVSESCRRCGERFGLYFCPRCRLYDDNVEKKQFHCDGCGLCRVGGRENFKHCERCCVCYKRELFDRHKCVERAMDCNCPVCLEHLHTSTKKLHLPKCGHFLHYTCFQELLKTRTTCPVCATSYFDMTTSHKMLDDEIRSMPMPEEYRNSFVRILCNDCLGKSYVRVHFVGRKCGSCGSYNTSIIEGPMNELPEGEPLPPPPGYMPSEVTNVAVSDAMAPSRQDSATVALQSAVSQLQSGSGASDTFALTRELLEAQEALGQLHMLSRPLGRTQSMPAGVAVRVEQQQQQQQRPPGSNAQLEPMEEGDEAATGHADAPTADDEPAHHEPSDSGAQS